MGPLNFTQLYVTPVTGIMLCQRRQTLRTDCARTIGSAHSPQQCLVYLLRMVSHHSVIIICCFHAHTYETVDAKSTCQQVQQVIITPQLWCRSLSRATMCLSKRGATRIKTTRLGLGTKASRLGFGKRLENG